MRPGEPQKIPRTLDEAFGPGARLDVGRQPQFERVAAIVAAVFLSGLVLCLIIL